MITQVLFIKNKFTNLLGRLIDEKGFYDSNWICEVSKSQLYNLYLKESKCMYTRSKMFFQKLKSYLPSTKYSFEEERLGQKRFIKHKVKIYDEEGVNRKKYIRYCILPKYEKACEEFFKTTGIKIDPPNIPTLNVYYMNQIVDENVSPNLLDLLPNNFPIYLQTDPKTQLTSPQSPQQTNDLPRPNLPSNFPKKKSHIGLHTEKKYTFNMITPDDYATGAYKSKRRKKEPELDETGKKKELGSDGNGLRGLSGVYGSVEDHSEAMNNFGNVYDTNLSFLDLIDIDENITQQLINQYQ